MARIKLNRGSLNGEEIDIMLRHIPADLTYVDEKDTVRYYTGRDKLIFSRSPNIIGSKVQDCHPAHVVPSVNRMIEEFRSGRQYMASSWTEKNGRFVYINYIALRDEKGRYRGILEITEDLSSKRRLQGQSPVSVWGDGDAKKDK